VNKNTIASICNGLPLSNPVISEKVMAPVAQYINEIPNNNMPDEKADESIIFIAASEEIFLSKSKLAIAATGMVANSRDKKNIKKFPLDISKSSPSRADNIKIKNSGKCSVFLNQSVNNKEIINTPKFRMLFWKKINTVVWNIPSNKLPAALKKNPATRFNNSKNWIRINNLSFLILLPNLINSNRKMIQVTTSSDFINVKKSFIQSLFTVCLLFFA